MSRKGTARELRTSSVQRRKFLKASAGVSVASMPGIAGCMGGGGGGGDDEGEIHIVSKETSQEARQWFETVAEEFEEETGTEVNMDYTDLSPVEHVSSLLQTGNPPELATAGVESVGELMMNDLLADVSDVIDVFESEYNDSVKEGSRIQNQEGEDQLLPLYTNSTEIWYWNDVYEEYGLESSPGLTWEEYREIVSEIHSQGDLNGTVIPSASSMLTSFQFWNFLFSNGGQVCEHVDGEFDVAMDQGENRELAIETVEFLNDLHQFSPEASGYEWGDILEDFVGRNSAHCIYGPRAKLQVIESRRERRDDARPHPVVHNGQETFMNSPDGMVLFDDAENKDAAREYLEFVARDNRYIDLLTSVSAVHNFPTMTDIVEMDEYRNSEFIAENFRDEDLEIIRESFENGQSILSETDPINPYAPQLYTTRALGDMLYNVNIEGMDPAQAVDDTAAQLRDTLNEVRGE